MYADRPGCIAYGGIEYKSQGKHIYRHQTCQQDSQGIVPEISAKVVLEISPEPFRIECFTLCHKPLFFEDTLDEILVEMYCVEQGFDIYLAFF